MKRGNQNTNQAREAEMN